MLKTIKTKRITEEIVEQIRDAIAQGSLKAGERLPAEREMARQLGVSRPSLRQALQVLEHTGFVAIVHGQGTYIRDIGEQALQDPLCSLLRDSNKIYLEMYEFRTEIETWAAGKTAAGIKPADAKQLRSVIERMQQRLAEQKTCHDLDTEFHLTIARASGNSIYFQIANTVFYLFGEVTRLSHEQLYRSRDSQQALFQEHKAIYEAIARKDVESARKLMHRHLQETEKQAKIKGIAWTGNNLK
ncbi:MAG: FadR/GntR family transcriptional regulator [Thermodesulfobacteriota bacterium]